MHSILRATSIFILWNQTSGLHLLPFSKFTFGIYNSGFHALYTFFHIPCILSCECRGIYASFGQVSSGFCLQAVVHRCYPYICFEVYDSFVCHNHLCLPHSSRKANFQGIFDMLMKVAFEKYMFRTSVLVALWTTVYLIFFISKFDNKSGI